MIHMYVYYCVQAISNLSIAQPSCSFNVCACVVGVSDNMRLEEAKRLYTYTHALLQDGYVDIITTKCMHSIKL